VPRYVYLTLLVVAICGANAAASAYAQTADVRAASELDRVIAKIQHKQAALKTFTATFEQTRTSDLLREPLHSEGVVYFDGGGRILMKVTSPSPLIVLLEKNRQVIYYPDLSRIEQKVFVQTSDIFKRYIGLGSSVETLKTRFAIEPVAGASATDYYFKMVPRQPDLAKQIAQIDVVVDPELCLPKQIDLTGTRGDHTSIRMRYTAVNETLPPDVFAIKLPENSTSTAGQKDGR
jgi:outer membrane lipoprotein-sorting protein